MRSITQHGASAFNIDDMYTIMMFPPFCPSDFAEEVVVRPPGPRLTPGAAESMHRAEAAVQMYADTLLLDYD